MKRFFAFFAMFSMMLSAWAQVEIDGICYNLYPNNKTASVRSKNPKYVGDVVIPSTITTGRENYTVTSIGTDAFHDCSGLTSVTIPNSVTLIDSYAFWICSGLTSVTIPNSVTEIGSYAFSECTSLTSINIPHSVTHIGNRAFHWCTSLKSINIPNSVTYIGGNAFYGGKSLTSIQVEEGNINYDSRDNCNAIIETATNTLVVGCQNTIIPNSVTCIGEYSFAVLPITSITIPNSVTSIKSGAFYSCKNLTSVIIPNSVTSIERSAFSGCSSLTSVTIPNSVTSIGDYAFSGCSSLTSLIIPNSVTSIGENAFSGCSNLISALNLATTPQSISSGTFASYGTLHVLPGCGDAYRAAEYWKNFTIVEDAVDPNAPTTIDIVDGIAYTQTTNTDLENLTYTRTFNNTGWQAFYVPFAMSYEDWSEDFEVAAINMFHQYDEDEDGIFDSMEMEVRKVKAGTLKPNHPYLIKAKTTGEKTITLTDATLYAADENSFECNSMEMKYTFTGTYTGVTGSTMVSEGYYSMGGGNLIQAENASANLNPYRWYLKMEARDGQVILPPASVKVCVWGEDDEEDGILSLDNEKENAPIYNLNGTKVVNANRPGLYIKNGKKYVVR